MVSNVSDCKFDFIISDTLLTKFDSTAYKSWGMKTDTIPTARLFDLLFRTTKIEKINSKNIVYKKGPTPFRYLSVSDCVFFNADNYTFALVQLRVKKKYTDKQARYYTYYLKRPKGGKNWTIIRGK
jgi:transglutaminase-like putative cysteine protease